MNPFGFDPFGDLNMQNDPLAQMRQMMMQPFPNFQHQQMNMMGSQPLFLNQSLAAPSMMMSPFSMFGHFGGLHQEMNNMMRGMHHHSVHHHQQTNPMAAGSSYQSFTSISYGSGNGQPVVYQSSSSTKVGPNGVRETKKTEKDSRTGVQRIEVGHHIGDRGHVIGKSKNVRTGDQEETQEYVNMAEDEATSFNAEWMARAGQSTQQQPRRSAITYRNHNFQPN